MLFTSYTGGSERSYADTIFGAYRNKLKKGKKISDIIMTEEGKYSSSTQRDMIETLRQTGGPYEQWTVTDATANIGGSTLGLASQVKHVNAVELSKDTFDVLSKNVGLFTFGNITLHNANYLDVCDTLEQDMVFIDPPWGGPDYKDKPKVSLYLGDVHLADVVIRVLPRAKVVVCKVPRNFDKDEFESKVHAEYKPVYNSRGGVKWINVIVKK